MDADELLTYALRATSDSAALARREMNSTFTDPDCR